MRNLLLVVFTLSFIALSGCSGVGALQSVAATYSSVRGGVQVYYATSMMKDLPPSEPYFVGYDAVLFRSAINPRKEVPGLSDAIIGNLTIYTEQVVSAVGAPIRICLDGAPCPGKVLVVSLMEDAYNKNLLQKFTVSHLLRGNLSYIDNASGSIRAQKRLEISESYAQLAQVSNAMILSAMLKSFPTTTEADAKRVVKKIETIPMIDPKYKDILKAS